ncbi:hypothetical protein [Halovivax limisalsi]|uniref:hypothetical protein n=1 Tax=Halovivax limisalsi TaxID=1453760 RepID=UPI001FFD8944|nr:hypothetical protein [Halovivax limisalsi]
MSDDEGYVHDPAAFDADGERRGEASDGSAERATDSRTGVHPTAADRTFGRRGWILVGVIVLAFVVAPLSIYVLTPEAEVYLMALIILPLFPAILLGLTAVWATTRP